MKSTWNTRHLTAVAAVVVCAVMLFLIFNQSGDTGRNPRRIPAITSPGAAGRAVPVQKMPDGTERPLSLRLPAIGRVQGSRWIPGHQFQRIGPESLSRIANLPLDVLVDAEGRFLAARRGGTRFDTRMSDTSMIRLLQYAIYRECEDRRQRQGGPPLPAVSRVSLSSLAWDDLRVGNAIKLVMNRGYSHMSNAGGNSSLEQILSRFEDTYYFFEVQFEGEANARHIAVRRFTDGRVWKDQSDGPNTFPALPEPYISGTNVNGSAVFYFVREQHPTEQREPSWLFLTEPWDGPCPWPEDRLDPNIGHDRINEFFFPDEAPVAPMPDILNLYNSNHQTGADKPFVERARQNKAARLAQEATGPPARGP